MANRVSFSGEQRGLPEIAAYHKDLESSLTLYFSAQSQIYSVRFVGYTAGEVIDELGERIAEADLTSSLTVLASVEAVFRVDYLQRCYRKEKDSLSRSFRLIYKAKQERASLKDEIFAAWVENYSGVRSIIGDLHSVFRFRDWLAHGRYWTPKLGRPYDFSDIFTLADQTLRSFPFL
jgi:hypothetical protein